MRKKAYDYGYLRSNPYCYVTNSGGYVEIQPVNPAYIYVPMYDPVVVFGPPRPGFRNRGRDTLWSGRGHWSKFFFRGDGRTRISLGWPRNHL